MIYTVNNSITIDRLADSSWEKTYSEEIERNIPAYIEPYQDEPWSTFDWQWPFNVFRMFTDIEIIQWDKIIDKDDTEYKVKGVRHYNSIVWNHNESVIQSIFD